MLSRSNNILTGILVFVERTSSLATFNTLENILNTTGNHLFYCRHLLVKHVGRSLSLQAMCTLLPNVNSLSSMV